jgi:hypothetical protein
VNRQNTFILLLDLKFSRQTIFTVQYRTALKLEKYRRFGKKVKRIGNVDKWYLFSRQGELPKIMYNDVNCFNVWHNASSCTINDHLIKQCYKQHRRQQWENNTPVFVVRIQWQPVQLREGKRTALRHSESITLRPAGGLNTAMQAEPLNSVLPIRLLAWVESLLHMNEARWLGIVEMQWASF